MSIPRKQNLGQNNPSHQKSRRKRISRKKIRKQPASPKAKRSSSSRPFPNNRHRRQASEQKGARRGRRSASRIFPKIRQTRRRPNLICAYRRRAENYLFYFYKIAG